MPKFNHMFDIAFSLDSEREDASDVTPSMLRAALLERIEDVFERSGEWEAACGLCDTYEYTDDGQATHVDKDQIK